MFDFKFTQLTLMLSGHYGPGYLLTVVVLLILMFVFLVRLWRDVRVPTWLSGLLIVLFALMVYSGWTTLHGYGYPIQ